MTSTAIRQQLHTYIDTTDDKKVEALYLLLQSDMSGNYNYTEEEVRTLHERAEEYLRGDTKTYTMEESHNMIRQKRKEHDL